MALKVKATYRSTNPSPKYPKPPSTLGNVFSCNSCDYNNDRGIEEAIQGKGNEAGTAS